MQFLWQTALILTVFVSVSYGGMRIVDHFLNKPPSLPPDASARACDGNGATCPHPPSG
jgi:hypothetical protein